MWTALNGFHGCESRAHKLGRGNGRKWGGVGGAIIWGGPAKYILFMYAILK